MAFTRVWNTALEAVPATSDDALEGAQRMRERWVDIRERMEVEHRFGDADDDGLHKKVTLAVQSAPSAVADAGILYALDVASKAELHYKDEDNNAVQLTSAGLMVGAFPATTAMVFHQATAPTGWTKDSTATLNNAALRIVTGATGGSAGGATAFTSVFGSSINTGSTTLTAAQSGLPAHTHVDNVSGVQVTFDNGSDTGAAQFSSGASTGSTGGTSASSGHTHTMGMDVKYHDVIVATKD